jgi:hypothetical protein
MKKKICFVSLGSYPLFSSDENLKYVGGAEVKQVLIGKELAKKGYDISFITYGREGKKEEQFDQIKIIKTFSPSDNLRLLKKATWLWNSLKESNSEIYIQSGGVLGFTALYCFIHKKKYIRWLSSDKYMFLEGIGNKTSTLTKIAL